MLDALSILWRGLFFFNSIYPRAFGTDCKASTSVTERAKLYLPNPET
jgi:hypothetical protein